MYTASIQSPVVAGQFKQGPLLELALSTVSSIEERQGVVVPEVQAVPRVEVAPRVEATQLDILV